MRNVRARGLRRNLSDLNSSKVLAVSSGDAIALFWLVFENDDFSISTLIYDLSGN